MVLLVSGAFCPVVTEDLAWVGEDLVAVSISQPRPRFRAAVLRVPYQAALQAAFDVVLAGLGPFDGCWSIAPVGRSLVRRPDRQRRREAHRLRLTSELRASP